MRDQGKIRETPAAVPRKLSSVIDDQAALAGFSRVRLAMVLTDPRAEDNPIIYVNAAFERTSGYERSAVIGRNCRFLQGEGTDKRTVDRLRAAIDAVEDVTVDIQNYRADGRPFMNRLIIAPITDADDQLIYFLGIQKELADAEREEERTSDLLQALTSRVRDDLAMVLRSLSPDEAQHRAEEEAAFDHEALARRVEVLQLAYEGMQLADSQSDGGGAIDLGSLLSRVAAAIAHDYGRPGIRYVQQIEPVEVNLEAAIRVALLISEVLSNAFTHAFERIDEGLIELRMNSLAAGGLRVLVTDDGIGFPSNRPFPDPDTIGGRLIDTLSRGLDATVTPVRGAAGTVVMIDVPVGVTDV